jgi:hypothetical protein
MAPEYHPRDGRVRGAILSSPSQPACSFTSSFAPHRARASLLLGCRRRVCRWGILPVFGKVGSQSGLPPGLAVAIQKAAELVGVLGTIFGS